jgi:hypothetical protein
LANLPGETPETGVIQMQGIDELSERRAARVAG